MEHALERNRVPPPSVDPGPTTTEAGSLIAGIQLLRAENQEWNHWSDDRTRLFNDAQGYLFELQYQGADGLRWRPESTTLEVNEEDARFTVASTADDCIFPLRIAASEEARHLEEVDLQARWLAATPFRVLYMPTGLLDSSGSGLLFFPAPAESLAPVAMRVRVVWERPDGELLFTTWLLE
ncbi:MAG: hypothetical protein QGG40_21530 [Myxococcota bacterium]|jgi:hypothetical protein|nr:hypothetical protein [Myxococcota bacterium]